MNVGDIITFSFAKMVQSYTIENTGLYQLEVSGARGGDLNNSNVGYFSGGNGGYAKGTVKLRRGTVLYIVTGGRDSYNGGGSANNWRGGDADPWTYSGAGGGATHIALTNYGTLPNYSTHQDDVLIVAGGGGGAYVYDDPSAYDDWGNNGGAGGNPDANGSFGQGGQWSTFAYASGGGGWRGGTQGAGGSSYVKSTMTDAQMIQGNNSSNGFAKLTLVKKMGIKYGSLDCEVVMEDHDIKSIKLGDMDVG